MEGVRIHESEITIPPEQSHLTSQTQTLLSVPCGLELAVGYGGRTSSSSAETTVP